MNRKTRIQESLLLDERIANVAEHKPLLQGVVAIKDSTGRILAIKKNTISYRARLLTLEKTFGMDVTDSNTNNIGTFSIPEYIYGNTSMGNRPCSFLNPLNIDGKGNYGVRLFSVGDRGCQLSVDGKILPFERSPVNTFDNDIYHYVPFKETSYEPPSAITPYVKRNGKFLFKKVNWNGSEIENPQWYLSVRPIDTSIKFDHEYAAIKYSLNIDQDDLVYTTFNTTPVINEVGLFICDENFSESSIEMFSHVTFDSISFKDYKSLLIEYYIFV